MRAKCQMPDPGGLSTSHTVLSASLSCTTTPTAANTNVPIPMTVASTPSYGRSAPFSMASTAWLPASPSSPFKEAKT